MRTSKSIVVGTAASALLIAAVRMGRLNHQRACCRSDRCWDCPGANHDEHPAPD
jgi:hypothetical protein